MSPRGGKRPERGTAPAGTNLYAQGDDFGGLPRGVAEQLKLFAFGQCAGYILTEGDIFMQLLRFNLGFDAEFRSIYSLLLFSVGIVHNSVPEEYQSPRRLN